MTWRMWMTAGCTGTRPGSEGGEAVLSVTHFMVILLLLVVGPDRHGCKDVNDSSVFLRRFPAWMCLRVCRLVTNGLMAAKARAHPHIPRRRKSISPDRASGGSTSPKGDPAQSFVLRYNDGSAPAESSFALVIATFFSRGRPLDRPRVYVDIEFLSESAWRASAVSAHRARLRRFAPVSTNRQCLHPGVVCGPRGRAQISGTNAATPPLSKLTPCSDST